jgi:hypothetical protein
MDTSKECCTNCSFNVPFTDKSMLGSSVTLPSKVFACTVLMFAPGFPPQIHLSDYPDTGMCEMFTPKGAASFAVVGSDPWTPIVFLPKPDFKPEALL